MPREIVVPSAGAFGSTRANTPSELNYGSGSPESVYLGFATPTPSLYVDLSTPALYVKTSGNGTRTGWEEISGGGGGGSAGLQHTTVTAADLVGGSQVIFTVPSGDIAWYPIIDGSTIEFTGNNGSWIVWMGTQAQFDFWGLDTAPATTTSHSFAVFDSDLWRDAYLLGTTDQASERQPFATDDVLAFLLSSDFGYIAATARQNAHVYGVGASMIANDAGNSNVPSIWFTTAGGTSAGSPPVFDSGSSPVTDGSVSWDFVDVVPDVGSCTIYVSFGTSTPV